MAQMSVKSSVTMHQACGRLARLKVFAGKVKRPSRVMHEWRDIIRALKAVTSKEGRLKLCTSVGNEVHQQANQDAAAAAVQVSSDKT